MATKRKRKPASRTRRARPKRGAPKSRAVRARETYETGEEPNARYGDQRLVRQSMREHPEGSAPPLERGVQHKDSDDAF